MSIFRSGLVNTVFVRCVKAIQQSGYSFQVGEKYALVLDMGTMYVVKTAAGQEAVVGKDAFVVAHEDEKPV